MLLLFAGSAFWRPPVYDSETHDLPRPACAVRGCVNFLSVYRLYGPCVNGCRDIHSGPIQVVSYKSVTSHSPDGEFTITGSETEGPEREHIKQVFAAFFLIGDFLLSAVPVSSVLRVGGLNIASL